MAGTGDCKVSPDRTPQQCCAEMQSRSLIVSHGRRGWTRECCGSEHSGPPPRRPGCVGRNRFVIRTVHPLTRPIGHPLPHRGLGPGGSQRASAHLLITRAQPTSNPPPHLPDPTPYARTSTLHAPRSTRHPPPATPLGRPMSAHTPPTSVSLVSSVSPSDTIRFFRSPRLSVPCLPLPNRYALSASGSRGPN